MQSSSLAHGIAWPNWRPDSAASMTRLSLYEARPSSINFRPPRIRTTQDYLRPWQGYQLATLGDTGLELRQAPVPGESGGARLSYSKITEIRVGVASFGTFTERAILIAGIEKGKAYEIGLAPIKPDSPSLTPVPDAQFMPLVSELIARVEGRIAP